MVGAKGSSRRRGEEGFSVLELLVVLLMIGVVAAIAIQTALYAFDVARVGRSVANMRQIASALMQYESNENSLPEGGPKPVAEILPVLGTQAGYLDSQDGFGWAIYYEAIDSGGRRNFRLMSYGKDGSPDGAITGNWLDFYSDVVLEGGVFLQTKW